MIVIKVGGSLLKNAANLLKIIDYVKKTGKDVVLVVSALYGITDILLESVNCALSGKDEEIGGNIKMIKQKHLELSRDSIKDEKEKKDISAFIEEKTEELMLILKSIGILGECTPKSSDYVVSFGEKLSSTLIAAALRSSGLKSSQIDGQKVIRTDSHYGDAYPDVEQTKRNAKSTLSGLLETGEIPVVMGYIGADKEGNVTTLGRGGTDYSATIIANILDANGLIFLKDVDGIMSADPKIVEKTKRIEEISFAEVSELSYFGAKVLHPRAIQPLLEKDIPVYVRSINDFSAKGTVILKNLSSTTGPPIKAITHIEHVSAITVHGTGLIGVPGIAARVFDIIAGQKTNILMISQSSSEQNISFVIADKDRPKAMKALEEELKTEIVEGKVSHIAYQNNISIVAVVGEGMRGRSGTAGKLFSLLGKEGINIRLIAQGSSELNISIVLDANDVKNAVSIIHDNFCG